MFTILTGRGNGGKSKSYDTFGFLLGSLLNTSVGVHCDEDIDGPISFIMDDAKLKLSQPEWKKFCDEYAVVFKENKLSDELWQKIKTDYADLFVYYIIDKDKMTIKRVI